MKDRHSALAVALVLCLAGTVAGQDGCGDELYLQERGLKTDAASLLALLGRQTAGQMPPDCDRLLNQLGHPSFDKREEAARRLIAAGPAVLERLRTATSGDAEVRFRVQRCVERIETSRDQTVGYFAVRRLLHTRPPGTTAALLAYLPDADAETLEEIWYGIEAVAVRDGRADPCLRAALTDDEPRRRSLAAYVLGRHGTDADRAQVCERLQDKDAEVRMRAAQGLLAGWDRRAVPALLALLEDAPVEVAWQAEELLHFLAGDDAPAATVGKGEAEVRRRCRTAWQAWWQTAGPRLDWERLERDRRRPGLVLTCLENRVCLCGCDGTIRWEMTQLGRPVEAYFVPGPRVMVIETSEGISERGLDGRTHWALEHLLGRSFLSSQRLSNGNTFVLNAGEQRELGPDGSYVPDSWVSAPRGLLEGVRLRDGRVLARSRDGVLVIDGTNGAVLREMDFMTGPRFETRIGGVFPAKLFAAFPDGSVCVYHEDNILIGLNAGGQVGWKRPVLGATALAPLRDGNFLVASAPNARIFVSTPSGRALAETYLSETPVGLSDAFPLLRLGFERANVSSFDLDAVDNRIRDLRHQDARMRQTAARALHEKGSAAVRAVPALLTTLDDRNAAVRGEAYLALTALGPAAVPDLIAALTHSSRRVRYDVLNLLIELGPEAKAAAPALVGLLDDPTRDTATRRQAAAALGAIQPEGEPARDALLRALAGADDLVREAAVQSLTEIATHDGKTIAALVAALRDADRPRGRIAAASALAHFGPNARDALPDLIGVLSDRRLDPDLRVAAADALGEMGSAARPAVGPLAAVLRDPGEPETLRLRAIFSLGALREHVVPILPVCQEVLSDPTLTEAMQKATWFLVDATEVHGRLEVLKGLVTAGPATTRAIAIERLLRLGPKARSALPVLQLAATQDDEPVVRELARLAFCQIDRAQPD